MFCKIFETDEYGQILVKADSGPDQDDPEIRFYVEPEGLGVCSIAIIFKDSDEGWDSRDSLMEDMDIDIAKRKAAEIFEIRDQMTASVTT